MTTEPALLDLWARRDARYAANPYRLTQEQEQGVRIWRLKEAQGWSRAERLAASWTQPEGRR